MGLRGSCLSLPSGVVRDKVGDILVQGEAGAQVLVDPELVEHFEMSLTQVGDGVGALGIRHTRRDLGLSKDRCRDGTGYSGGSWETMPAWRQLQPGVLQVRAGADGQGRVWSTKPDGSDKAAVLVLLWDDSSDSRSSDMSASCRCRAYPRETLESLQPARCLRSSPHPMADPVLTMSYTPLRCLPGCVVARLLSHFPPDAGTHPLTPCCRRTTSCPHPISLQVRTVPVEVRRIPLSELSVRPPRQEEVSSVEASLRLDAIASAGGWRTVGLGTSMCTHGGRRKRRQVMSAWVVVTAAGW